MIANVETMKLGYLHEFAVSDCIAPEEFMTGHGWNVVRGCLVCVMFVSCQAW